MKPPLKIGETITNNELKNIFKCSNQGGMRRSHRTNTLVIVSDHTKELYDDREVDGIFKYTGEGRQGDQDLKKRQNKTLLESRTNRVDIYLFEVKIRGQYVFRGQVELVGDPYQEEQFDKNKHQRLVWVFPLKINDY